MLALDYGSARTGVAVSDPTGTVARPLRTLQRVTAADVRALVEEEEAERVVVGLPLTLRGEHGAQAEETARFVEALRATLAVPVETFDERFTTVLARAGGALAGKRAPGDGDDAVAAAHLLSSYLEWSSRRT